MFLINLLIILYLSCLTDIATNVTLSNLLCSCGAYTVDSLQMHLPYSSHKNVPPLDIKISSEDDFHGPFGTTSVGFFVKPDNTVQCIAVKINQGFGGNRIVTKARRIMEKIQEKLQKPQRKHLIELFDSGNTLRFHVDIMILELGVETFHERLYKRNDSYENDLEMMKIIRDLTVPIKEMHQVAIHMKISPQNYMYVFENDELLLKLKDFDNAILIDSNDKNERYLYEIDALDAFSSSFSQEYMGPEHYQPEKEISTKFDIWSLGMIIFEIHIDQLRFMNGKAPLTELNKGYTLRDLGDLYLGFERNRTGNFIGLNNKVEIFNDNSWIRQYKKAIFVILQLWRKFPKTALLVTNLLHHQRERRLTAQGILRYLDSRCCPEELAPIRNAKELRIFSKLSIGDFKRLVEKKMRVNRLNLWRSENREMRTDYEQMKNALKQIIAEQQRHIQQQSMEENEIICEIG